MSNEEKKTVTIKVGLSIGLVHGREDEIEVYVDGLETQEEINKACEKEANEWASNYIDLWWEIKND
jgi:hypothetical protein